MFFLKRKNNDIKTDLNLQIRFFRVIVSDDVCLIKRAQRVRTSDKMYKHTFLEPPSVLTLTDFTFDFHIFGVFL